MRRIRKPPIGHYAIALGPRKGRHVVCIIGHCCGTSMRKCSVVLVLYTRTGRVDKIDISDIQPPSLGDLLKRPTRKWHIS